MNDLWTVLDRSTDFAPLPHERPRSESLGVMGAGARKDALGRFGEQLATSYLQDLGFVLLSRNWRSNDPDVRGEIDLVCREGSAVVFCEVKTRSSLAYGLPAEAVSRSKQRKIRALARAWLTEQESGWVEVRFDVISVLRSACGPATVEHLRAAF